MADQLRNLILCSACMHVVCIHLRLKFKDVGLCPLAVSTQLIIHRTLEHMGKNCLGMGRGWEGGREGEREGWEEGEREGGREGGRKGEVWEGGMEGRGGREGRREGGERGMENTCHKDKDPSTISLRYRGTLYSTTYMYMYVCSFFPLFLS